MTRAKTEVGPLIRARARLRPKAQLTLPDEIRRALHVSEGDEIEFAMQEDGTIVVRGFVSVPTDQAWYFTPERQAVGPQADEEAAVARGGAGRVLHPSTQGMLDHLDTQDAADT